MGAGSTFYYRPPQDGALGWLSSPADQQGAPAWKLKNDNPDPRRRERLGRKSWIETAKTAGATTGCSQLKDESYVTRPRLASPRRHPPGRRVWRRWGRR